MNYRQRLIWATLAMGGPGAVLAEKGIDAFVASKYTYCDAKILSALWKESIEEAKASIGDKLAAGQAAAVESELGEAREAALKDASRRCSFDETGFTFEDAEKLAKLWNLSIEESKTMVEEKVLAGAEDVIRETLGEAAEPDGHP